MESKIYPEHCSFFEIKRIIQKMNAKYPFLDVKVIERSVSGKEIFSLSIGSEEETVLYLGGDDPAAPITTLILLRFCEEICHSILKGKELCGLDMRKALFGRKLTFIPLLNPDGMEIRRRGFSESDYMCKNLFDNQKVDFSVWKSNLRGVEVCRNFDFDFEKRREKERLMGIRHPAPFGFSGYRCQSEVETIALCKFCEKTNVNHLVHLSTFGETVSYSGLKNTPKESVKMAEIISAVSKYSICPPMVKADSIICEWFTAKYLKSGLCLKLGKDKIPTVEQLYWVYKDLKEALTLSTLF